VKFYDHADVYEALDEGEVDVVVGFTTDPQMKDPVYRVLDDDEGLFGRYFGILVARQDFLDSHKGLRPALEKALEWKITKETMSQWLREADRIMDGHIEKVEKIADKFVKNTNV
jgi:osmoprotectant transport system substrate-binding protein